MPPVLPYVPQRITVHLGSPSSNAENVTVSFSDYVKNVASSEIYPTWDESALRANILAIVSFALNRVYTEFYRSRGYDFDITNSTAYDQYFVKGRSFFENVERLVDELFNDYLRRPGFVEPRPNSATAPPPPAKGSASGAARIWPSRGITPRKFCAPIMAIISKSSPMHPSGASLPPIPVRPCAGVHRAPVWWPFRWS